MENYLIQVTIFKAFDKSKYQLEIISPALLESRSFNKLAEAVEEAYKFMAREKIRNG